VIQEVQKSCYKCYKCINNKPERKVSVSAIHFKYLESNRKRYINAQNALRLSNNAAGLSAICFDKVKQYGNIVKHQQYKANPSKQRANGM